MDAITPPAFDVILLGLTIPLIIAVTALAAVRVRHYRRWRGPNRLAGVVSAAAFLAFGWGCISRPLADLWPQLAPAERIAVSAVRVIVFVCTVVLLYHELDEEDP